jgi:8-oxo-dGTP diphosphatase
MLILKKRPAWQDGLLNGIGGKIEPGETPEAAIQRESFEEAGATDLTWVKFATLTSDATIIHCFSAFTTEAKFKQLNTMTDERLTPCWTDMVWSQRTIPEVPLLIQLALDRSGIAKPVVFDFVPIKT